MARQCGRAHHTQSSADFYQVFFQTAPADGLHTSDYRMAGSDRSRGSPE